MDEKKKLKLMYKMSLRNGGWRKESKSQKNVVSGWWSLVTYGKL